MRKLLGKYIKELSKAVDRASNIAVISHINPDGDAVGSMLGIYHYLASLGKACRAVSPNELQDFLLWMDGAGEVIIASRDPGSAISAIRGADLVIMVDFNHPSRIGSLYDHVKELRMATVLIDHHPGREMDADLTISEPSMSSTAEMIFELVMLSGKTEKLGRSFYDSVYVGMMTDTGNFNFGTFDGDTLRNVAFMLDSGLDKDSITDRVYNNFSASRMKLLGFALLERMVVLERHHTAYIYLTRADLDRFSHAQGDTEGFVNMPLTIRGIFFSVLFTEMDDHIKLSLRSKGNFAVNEFAGKYFSGGGHRNAAGGRYYSDMKGSLQYFEKVVEAIKDQIGHEV